MSVAFNERDDILYITIDGDIDITNVTTLKNSISEGIIKSNKDLKLDLSSVEYIDSSGITLLFKIKEIQEKINKKFSISNASHNVRSILQISSLEEMLMIE